MRRCCAAIALILSLGGCDALDKLLEVEAPDRVLPVYLDDPEQASLWVNSAVGAFECAFNHYVVATGLISDELGEGGGHTDTHGYDRRNFSPSEPEYQDAHGDCGRGSHLGLYMPVSRARWLADHVTKKLEGWSDAEVAGRTSLIATVAAYSGYSYMLLGEGFCAAAVDGGPRLTPADLLREAEKKFTAAIQAAEASGNSEIRNMALVGRARARLNLGTKSQAAADARLVPAGFVKNATYSSASPFRENKVYDTNTRGRRITVDEPYWSLSFGGVPDPRVRVTRTGGRTQNNLRPLALQNKYTAASSPIPLATWDEAQLIIAEAEGGQAAVNIINALHARVGLPAFSSADSKEILAQTIEERRRELFLESQRLYDIIRYQLPLLPPAGAPFPEGGFYGTMTCLPLPDIEKNNNPNLRD
ncbi:MAG: RagB/SusD family nutrient uptake outer membrane protein [Gemmatimonadetes bacterium]|nr:RagB/SusD family nutrient uptake outer membrane protein [Gemmatimonadota bacterium]